MNPKMQEIESLLQKGFDLEEIASDSGVVEVILTRGSSTRVVTIDRLDAAELLYGVPNEPRREMSVFR